MNTQPNYTLVSQPPTSRLLRAWASLSRGTFSMAIFLIDVALIVATSCATGVVYYRVAYGDIDEISRCVQVGLLAASIFTISNVFRGEYRMPNFFAFKPHARRTIQLWNVTLICLLMLGFLAQVSVDYSRGWIVLFYFATLTALVVSRFAIVRITALARAAGLVSAQRICLIGTGAHIGAFVQHYEPWALGLAIVGCRFLTPVPATAPIETRRAALDRDLAEAAASVRSLEPDAIYLLLPWSATEIIDRCAKTFLALPVEIHLG
ncbi:MAG: hypothetical protein WBG12_13555, partial [Xanthobacteraceae bacterium]